MNASQALNAIAYLNNEKITVAALVPKKINGKYRDKWQYIETYLPGELVDAYKSQGFEAFTMPNYLKDQAL